MAKVLVTGAAAEVCGYMAKVLVTGAAAEVCGYHPEARGMTDRLEGVFVRGGDTTKQAKFGLVAGTPLADGVRRVVEHLDASVRPASRTSSSRFSVPACG